MVENPNNVKAETLGLDELWTECDSETVKWVRDEEVNRWNPISTAQKDESEDLELLIYEDGYARVEIGCWSERFEAWSPELRGGDGVVVGYRLLPSTSDLEDAAYQLHERL